MLVRVKFTAAAFSRLPDTIRGFSFQTGDAAPDAPPAPDRSELARSEEYRLIQQLFLQPDSPAHRMIAFAEIERHSGGATICARIAQGLADQVEGSICVVEADLQRPSLCRHFGVRASRGLSDVWRDGGSPRAHAQQVGANLWLLAPGPPSAEAVVIPPSSRLRSLCKELREQFDYVLISAPPFAERAESTMLSQLTDGVVLIVEAHVTRRERARAIKDHLIAARVPLLGVVLNNRTFPIPDAIYRRL